MFPPAVQLEGIAIHPNGAGLATAFRNDSAIQVRRRDKRCRKRRERGEEGGRRGGEGEVMERGRRRRRGDCEESTATDRDRGR